MDRFMPATWPLPQIDRWNEPFFTSGKLMVQICASCGAPQHPPGDVCYRCQGMTFEYREASGTGKVFSYTVIHHPVNERLNPLVPYAVVLVQLDDYPDVRITGNVVNLDPAQVRIGLPVRVVWEEVQDDLQECLLRLPQWQGVV